jgi:SET domain-containing protein
MCTTYLKIGETKDKGRGMITKKALKAGLIIETSPVIVMDAEERKHIEKTKLFNYIFEWQPEGADLCCMALGNVPLYNHSYRSNCEYYMDYDNDTIFIQTVRAIKEGEELTINYNGTWNDKSKVWFDAV